MRLIMQFNGETFEKRPKTVDAIKATILSLKPDWLHTDLFFTLHNVKEDVRERHLNLLQGKKLFNNENFLDVFIINLLLK